MTDVEVLCDTIVNQGYILAMTRINSTKLGALSCVLDRDTCAIAIDEKKFRNSAGIKTALLHEHAHCETGTFYNEYTPCQTRARLEYRADKFVAENTIKKSDIISAYEKTGITEIWEFAEYFNITIEYMKRMFYIHFRMEFLN